MKTIYVKVIHYQDRVLQVELSQDNYARYNVDDKLVAKCIELQCGNEIQILVDDANNLIDVVKKEIR